MTTINIEIPKEARLIDVITLGSDALNAVVKHRNGQITFTPEGSIVQTFKGIIDSRPANSRTPVDPLDAILNTLDEVDHSVWSQNLAIETAKNRLVKAIQKTKSGVKRHDVQSHEL